MNEDHRETSIAVVLGKCDRLYLPSNFLLSESPSGTAARTLFSSTWEQASTLERQAQIGEVLLWAARYNAIAKLIWTFSMVALSRAEIVRAVGILEKQASLPILAFLDMKVSREGVTTMGLAAFCGYEILVEGGRYDEHATLTYAARIAEAVMNGLKLRAGQRIHDKPLAGLVISSPDEPNGISWIRMIDTSDLDAI